jgi:hypothetical protein
VYIVMKDPVYIVMMVDAYIVHLGLKLKNWWLDTHTKMTSFDANYFMSNF